MSKTRRRSLAMPAALGLVACGACRPAAAPIAPTPSPTVAKAVVIFPDELHAEDATVNDFVKRAIDACAAEDYDAFRLLWSARDKPIGEGEFIRGWQAARKVSILDLQKRRDPRNNEIVYVVHGRVEFDPTKVPKPEREIVLLLVKENDRWCMARAPRKVAKALRARAAADADTNGN